MSVAVPSSTKKNSGSSVSVSASNSRIVNQTAHGFLVGELVYKNSLNIWLRAIADENSIVNDSFATNIVSKVNTANQFAVDRDISLGLLAFAGITSPTPTAYYLSQTLAGTPTAVEPVSGNIQQLGWGDNGTLEFYPEVPKNLDLISSPTGTVVTRVVATANYFLEETKCGCDITIYVKLKENTTGAKTFNMNLIEQGNYRFVQFFRYTQAIETLNLLINGFNSPVLAFNKLLTDAHTETFGVSGIGGAVGTHSVLDNGAYNSNIFPGSAQPRYFNSELLLKTEFQNVTMAVTYAGDCLSQVGNIFQGLAFPII